MTFLFKKYIVNFGIILIKFIFCNQFSVINSSFAKQEHRIDVFALEKKY